MQLANHSSVSSTALYRTLPLRNFSIAELTSLNLNFSIMGLISLDAANVSISYMSYLVPEFEPTTVFCL